MTDLMGKRKPPKTLPTERARKIQDIRIQIVELELQIQELNDEFLQEVYLLLGLNSDDLSLGFQDCPHLENTEHLCVYDDANDPNHDECVFCGDTEDRS